MMITNIFNSPFEVSLRVLLLLESLKGSSYSSDILAAIDFMVVYGQDFGVSNVNLHGDNLFKYSEFATRRELTNEATKHLVRKGLISINSTKDGFTYIISTVGIQYCTSLKSDYANAYRKIALKLKEKIEGMSEQQILSLINKHSIYSLRKGDN